MNPVDNASILSNFFTKGLLLLSFFVILVLIFERRFKIWLNQKQKKYVRKNEKQKIKNTHNYPYIKNKTLFTKTECYFLEALTLAVEDDYKIFGKVRIADVVRVKPTKNRSEWQVAFNNISAKHFDYVLCNKDSLEICAVIELDDSTHNTLKARKRDNFKNEVCKASNLPLLRVPVEVDYNIEIIKIKINEAIHFSPSS